MNNSDLKSGILLVAGAMIGEDPDFGKAVIFLAGFGESGVIGFNIAGKVEDGWLNNGGPIDSPLFIVAKINDHTFHYEVGSSGYAFTTFGEDGQETADFRARISSLIESNKGHCLAVSGYAGWDKPQLEREVASGFWTVLDASLDQFLSLPEGERWNHAQKLLGSGDSTQS